MNHLLDVNVLIALLDTLHRFHDTAWTWFNDHRAEGWSTCPITQNGVIRILSNPQYANSGAGTEEIASLLADFTTVSDHRFLPDDVSLLDTTLIERNALRRHHAVTDQYLLVLAIHHGSRLATLDRRIRNDGIKRGVNALTFIVPDQASNSMSQ